MDILKFITAGSVDDGKSTLIGRLLFDCNAILKDQLDAITKQSQSKVSNGIDMALLTDGLKAEREQGITIDVAYKYFSTPLRKFIIIDAPGHIQYTRNMITGASNASLIIILINAGTGITEQTRRHLLIASILNIHNIIVAVNKMDLVSYSENIYNAICKDFQKLADALALKNIKYIPISALHGDNIVYRSKLMSWYDDDPLLTLLEKSPVHDNRSLKYARFPIQFIIRCETNNFQYYRGCAGKIISGIFRKDDQVVILPSGIESSIETIEVSGKEVNEAFAPQSAVIRIKDNIDVSRGTMIAKKQNMPRLVCQTSAVICWMDNRPLLPGKKYLLQINSLMVKCMVTEILYFYDLTTMSQKYPQYQSADLNDIFKAVIKCASPIPIDDFYKVRANGSAILIDEVDYMTVGACMLHLLPN